MKKLLYNITKYYFLLGLLFLFFSKILYGDIFSGLVVYSIIGGVLYGLIKKSILIAFNGIGSAVLFYKWFNVALEINFLLGSVLVGSILILLYFYFKSDFDKLNEELHKTY